MSVSTLHTDAAVGQVAGRLRAVTGELASIVASLDAAGLTGLSGAEAAQAALLFAQIERLATAGKTFAAGRVAETGHYRAEGYDRPARWLAARTKTSGWDAATTITTAAHLAGGSLAPVRAAVLAGRLTGPQTAEITAAAVKAPDQQDHLLGFARRETFRQLKDECQRIRLTRQRSEDPAARRRRIVEEMSLTHRNLGDGLSELRATMPTSWLVLTLAAVNQQCETIFANARRAGRTDPHQAYLVEALVTLLLIGPLHAGPPPTPPSTRHAGTAEDCEDREDDADSGAEDLEDRPGGDLGGHDAGEVGQDRDGPAGMGRPQRVSGPDPTDQPGPDPHPGEPARPAASGSTQPDARHDAPTTGPTRGGDRLERPDASPDPPGDHDTEPDDIAAAHAALLAAIDGPASPSLARPSRQARRGRCSCGRRVMPRAKIIIRVDQTALLRGHTTGDELCDIPGIGPVPVATVRELWPDAVAKLVLTNGTEVRTVITLNRRATDAMETAMQLATPMCSNIACDHQRFIQIDHRLGYAHTHRTQLDELDPLCTTCHNLKTNHNWQLVSGTGRRPFVPPEHPDHPGHPPTPRRPPARSP